MDLFELGIAVRKRKWKHQPEVIDGTKQCIVCDEIKSVNDFYVDAKARCGYRGRCKKCEIAYLNKMKSGSIDYFLKGLVQTNKTNGKHGSQRRREYSENSCITAEFLTEMWAKQDGKCAVTGVPMTHIQGQGRKIWTNVTVDRVDCEIGYVADNCRLVCRAVNYMKNAMTDKEMLQWCALILNGPCKYV